MSELSNVSVIVQGHVQGVFYRVFASRVAKSLGVRGYVQNLPRGGVEVRAEGEKSKLEELVRQLEIGPPEALVGPAPANDSPVLRSRSRQRLR